ncbi:hypothetical protein L1S34_10035 [Flavobacterium sp. K77]|uniref:toxin-antitoxin system YwqK family antitoxin n=1 Tax=Flavobacterium sp. K77 TaxID=2910676 RepID=UPI001F2AAC8E|nr:hypothetical protein [Flavobacterium sp. K77]MCF6141624.1 hypothetical protein [Flavobacterium sp. K77]
MIKFKSNIFLFFIVLMTFGIAHSQADFNKMDPQGKKHGLWKGFYEQSKRPRYEGIFEHGKEVGVFYFYDDTKAKSIIATREFNTKDNGAYTTFFDQNKNKVSEGNVVNKLFEGVWTYYHKDSKNIMTTEFYKKGKLEGIRKVFFISGALAEEITFTNNLKNGLYKKYTERGVVLEESNYKNDQYEGKAIFRDVFGNIVSQGMFVQGKKAGMWQFFEKGKLVKETNMSALSKMIKVKTN